MNRDLFLDTLRRALYGKISDAALADHVRYYENYIAQEMSKGRNEQEVLEELGDPRLIARTILDASGSGSVGESYTVVDEDGQEDAGEMHVHQVSGWKATALMVLVLAVILLVLVLVFRLFVALLPLLIVVGVIVWLAKKIWY